MKKNNTILVNSISYLYISIHLPGDTNLAGKRPKMAEEEGEDVEKEEEEEEDEEEEEEKEEVEEEEEEKEESATEEEVEGNEKTVVGKPGWPRGVRMIVFVPAVQ